MLKYKSIIHAIFFLQIGLFDQFQEDQRFLGAFQQLEITTRKI